MLSAFIRFMRDASLFYSPRIRVVLVGLLALKLLVSAYNATTFDSSREYDPNMQSVSLATCGLFMSDLNYNPPLYYLTLCPATAATYAWWLPYQYMQFRAAKQAEPAAKVPSHSSFRAWISGATKGHSVGFAELGPAEFGRAMNLLLLGLFYGLSLFVLFPRALGEEMSSFAVSIFLLALPGYQRLAAMVNPDNLLTFGVLAGFLALVHAMRDTLSPARRKWLAFVAIGGLTLTRPLALVPVIALTAYFLIAQSDGSMASIAQSVRRNFIVLLGVFLLGTGWYAYRAAMVGPAQTFRAAPAAYVAKYRARAHGFDYARYYTKTYFGDLYRTPDRLYAKEDPPCAQENYTCPGRNDSFWTVLFSDAFGDHYLYASGPVQTDQKVRLKRIAFAAAAVFAPVALLLTAIGAWRWVRQRHRIVPGETIGRLEWAVIAALGFGGFASFMLWQATAGLEPGKNGSLKFVYYAFAVPFLLAFAGKGMPANRIAAIAVIAVGIAGYFAFLPIAAL